MPKQRLTVSLPVELLERLRNVTYWSENQTLARIVETAIADHLDQRERSYGGPYPPRLTALKGGRRRRQIVGRPSDTTGSPVQPVLAGSIESVSASNGVGDFSTPS
jgi:hypothetical protein